MTILFYVLTILFERILGLSSLLSLPISAVLGKLTKHMIIATAIAGFITFYFYNYLWQKIEGGSFPFILLVLIMLSEIGLMNSNKLTFAGNKYTKGILIGEILFMIYLLYFQEFRLY